MEKKREKQTESGEKRSAPLILMLMPVRGPRQCHNKDASSILFDLRWAAKRNNDGPGVPKLQPSANRCTVRNVWVFIIIFDNLLLGNTIH